MKFVTAEVRSVKADLAKGDISITFRVSVEEQAYAEELAQYAGKDAGTVILTVEPRQMALMEMARATKGTALEGAELTVERPEESEEE